ncbi:hypothetical protein L596_005604 [Steinernema carpocapsae]|uniref:NOT2/NOT3/NOT5 C-terminal domain-containing protein n=1 Tax=Steinernema carpocapsae TaxID=34508 RepID=A0A4U8UZJ1_STECR|nr:hypothetical protein L596_005604 [Steinernema carpocapsae]
MSSNLGVHPDYRKLLANGVESLDNSVLEMLLHPAARPRDPRYNFGGPFIGNHRRMHDIPAGIPDEYRVSVLSRMPDPDGKVNRLNSFKESRHSEEVLFHIFYNICGESHQIVAATELFARGWRYLKPQMIWITRSQFAVTEQTQTQERAIYTYFDKQLWRKMSKEMIICYTDIDGRPTFPTGATEPVQGGLAAAHEKEKQREKEEHEERERKHELEKKLEAEMKLEMGKKLEIEKNVEMMLKRESERQGK